MTTNNDFIILPLANPSFEREQIDIDEIRRLSALGLDQCEYEDRAVAWLCLLDIYPKDPLNWGKVKSEIKTAYFVFVKEMGLEDWHTKNFPNQLQIEEFKLNNNSLMGIVHGDIVRTGRTIFFLPPDPIPSETPPNEADVFMYQFGRHVRRLERVLYIFASYNGLGYMQGFNELVTPFYYVYLKAFQFFNEDIELLEALTFQSLQTLLTETALHEFYTTDDKSSIIMHKLEDFNRLLAKHLPDVYGLLEALNIHPLLYCFRWFNLLFCQEHDLPNLITIWDDLFAHFDQLMDFVFYVGIGHLNEIKDSLQKNNYGETVYSLQNIPPEINLKTVLIKANYFWDLDHKGPSGGFKFFSRK